MCERGNFVMLAGFRLCCSLHLPSMEVIEYGMSKIPRMAYARQETVLKASQNLTLAQIDCTVNTTVKDPSLKKNYYRIGRTRCAIFSYE